MKLLLWDIDGTMMHAGEISFERFFVCIEQELGRPFLDEHRPERHVVGSTDPVIVRGLLEQSGVPENEIDEIAINVLAQFENYFDTHRDAIGDQVVELPGVRTILSNFAHDTFAINSLVTGNLRPIAQRKLSLVDLDSFFDFKLGAFSNDNPERAELPPIAKKRAENHVGTTIDPDDIWVIGDSEGDYRCAQSIGAHTLLVGTSEVDMDHLGSLGADLVVPDLSDTDYLIDVLTK